MFLSPPRQQYRFDFNLAEKPYESYSGLNVRVRYFVRVTISTRGKNVTREMDFVVQNIQQVMTLSQFVRIAHQVPITYMPPKVGIRLG